MANKTYKNKTYCTYNLCSKWNDCEKALTNRISIAAIHWWKGLKRKTDNGAPVLIFTKKPECFKKIEEEILNGNNN